MTDPSARIEQLSSREVYANEWLRLREDRVRFPNGETGQYTVVDKPDFVLVLPFADDGFWLVQQYRYPVGSRQWEFPQGGWPPGSTGTQSELAAEELAEETGLVATTLTHLGRLFAAYGFASQRYDVYVATGLMVGVPRREATESDMVHRWFSRDHVDAMARSGDLADAHSLAALALFDRRDP